MVYDSGATSNFGREVDNFILSKIPSKKVFHVPNVATAISSVKAKMHHKLRETEGSVEMVPGLNHNSLMSARKFRIQNISQY